MAQCNDQRYYITRSMYDIHKTQSRQNKKIVSADNHNDYSSRLQRCYDVVLNIGHFLSLSSTMVRCMKVTSSSRSDEDDVRWTASHVTRAPGGRGCRWWLPTSVRPTSLTTSVMLATGALKSAAPLPSGTRSTLTRLRWVTRSRVSSSTSSVVADSASRSTSTLTGPPT